MLVRVQEVSKVYQSGDVKRTVLNKVNLTLEKGAIGVILGPSGSGKSTLMNIIGGVDRADSGEVEVDGISVTGLSDAQLTDYRRQAIGFIFQFYNLIGNLTVRENIEVVAHIAKQPPAIDTVLEAVGLAGLAGRSPAELSGGEQQRVAIARAVVKNPKLLLCDEPTGALDVESAKGVLALLQRINRTMGATILMITHNTAIGGMAHVVFKLRDGEVVETIANPATVDATEIEW